MNRQPTLTNTLQPWRITIFLVLMGAVILIFATRLFSLQILGSGDWVAQAIDQRTLELSVPTLRGTILDRNGTILARNVASYNVTITPASLPDDPGDIQEIYRQLSELVNVPINLNEITLDNPFVACVSEHGINQITTFGENTAPFRAVPVACNVDATTAMIVQERAVDWPGVGVEIEPVREYPTGELTASIIGFLGPVPANREQVFRAQGLDPNRDKVGYAGVELWFQDILAGLNGQRTVEVDVAG